MRIGILTGGGDCPGLNAVIRAVVRKGIFHHNDEFIGFLEGWRGVMDDRSVKLTLDSIAGILPRGGTILRTSRTNPAKKEGGMQQCLDTLKRHNLEALIVLGGDDTQSVTYKLHESGFVELVSDRLRVVRSEEHTSELQSRPHLVCRLRLEKKKESRRVFT